MKHIIFVLSLVLAVAITGCDKGVSGGPGVDKPDSEQATVGLTEDTFSLDVPMMSTKIAQGESTEVTIGIDRGRNIDQDVTLRFEEVPTGVSVAPENPVITRGEDEVTVDVSATAGAALGDFTVQVTGKPKSGASATNEIKITVEKS